MQAYACLSSNLHTQTVTSCSGHNNNIYICIISILIDCWYALIISLCIHVQVTRVPVIHIVSMDRYCCAIITKLAPVSIRNKYHKSCICIFVCVCV